MMEAESSPLYWQLEQIINVPHASYLRLYIELPADSCELPRGTSDTRMSPLIGANTATPSFQREEGRTASTLGRQPEVLPWSCPLKAAQLSPGFLPWET